jgi:hypothetical protein
MSFPAVPTFCAERRVQAGLVLSCACFTASAMMPGR